jgi:hypothetical protein
MYITTSRVTSSGNPEPRRTARVPNAPACGVWGEMPALSGGVKLRKIFHLTLRDFLTIFRMHR